MRAFVPVRRCIFLVCVFCCVHMVSSLSLRCMSFRWTCSDQYGKVPFHAPQSNVVPIAQYLCLIDLSGYEHHNIIYSSITSFFIFCGDSAKGCCEQLALSCCLCEFHCEVWSAECNLFVVQNITLVIDIRHSQSRIVAG